MKARIYYKGGDTHEVDGAVEFANGWLVVRSKDDPNSFTAYSDEQVLKVEVIPA